MRHGVIWRIAPVQLQIAEVAGLHTSLPDTKKNRLFVDKKGSSGRVLEGPSRAVSAVSLSGALPCMLWAGAEDDTVLTSAGLKGCWWKAHRQSLLSVAM